VIPEQIIFVSRGITVHSAVVYVILVCRQLSSRTRVELSILVLLESCPQTCMTYTIAEHTVNKLLMMDIRTVWNMRSFMPKIKFVKLVHLVGFIIKKSGT